MLSTAIKKKNKVAFFLLFALFLPTLFSCNSWKKIVYFQPGDGERYYKNPQNGVISFEEISISQPSPAKIQTNDILAVAVSSLSEESNRIFNVANTSPISTTIFPGTLGGNLGHQPLGYALDSVGNILLPMVGNVSVVGLTLDEAAGLIKTKLSKILKEPAVNMRFMNHKFTIIGEVNRPLVYNLLDDYTTLPDAIGMAGDLTVYGKRDKVVVVRNKNGNREVATIDISTRDFFKSPYYYIQNGDIIYIEPRKSKITTTDRTVQLLPIIISSISALAIAFNVLLVGNVIR